MNFSESATGSKPQRGLGWGVAPSLREVIALWLLTCFIFVLGVAPLCNYFELVDRFGDSSAYMQIATSIRHWNFQGVMIKQFWGLPYAMAALSFAGICERTALLLLCFSSSLASVVIAYRLWGGWISGFFTILNFDWIQRSFLGGSEPLFVALLFASFLAVRKQRWWLAALLAALATVVRPLGIFALLAIGLLLLWKREYRNLALSVAIGVVVGILYALPLAMKTGDALATVHSYHSPEWQGGWLFGFPFYAIVKGTFTEPAPWTNLVASFAWIFLVLIAVIIMLRSVIRRNGQFRQYAQAHAVEILFLIPFLWCLFTYNYPHWARGNFERFSIPILPFILIAWNGWIPKDRRLLWTLGAVMPLMAAVSALGLGNVAGLVRRAIG